MKITDLVKNKTYILLLFVVLCPVVRAQNNPYIDDKLIHFGFSLGVNMMAYGVTESGLPVDIYHGGSTPRPDTCFVRQSSMMPGFSVGFITDLRLCKFLNLRFTPGLSFSSRTLSYKTQSGLPAEDKGSGLTSKVDVLAIPINFPLFLKFSAEREGNYRPYVIIGGGGSYNVFTDRKKPIAQSGWDAFIEAGFGCDFYFSWFKFCPEIRYQVGFLNQLMPLEARPELTERNQFYTTSVSRLRNHTISIIFNFE